MRLIPILVLSVLSNYAIAQKTFLDPGFGDGGIVKTYTGGHTDNGGVFSLGIQSDQRIIASGFASGQGVVIRYNQNGTIDSSFAINGIFASSTLWGAAMKVLPNDKILVTGALTTFRLNSNGTLDNTFGVGGVYTADIDIQSKAMALQTDGKIVIAGVVAGVRSGVIKLLPDGAVDSSFGTYGLVTNNWPLDTHGVAVLSDGRIVTCGLSYPNFFMAV